MSDKKGNFNFGNISGNATVNQAGGDINQAGGDIVRGNKITSTDNSTNYIGFKKETDKEQFLTELENLRSLLRSVKGEIETSHSLDEDKRDEMSLALIQQTKALKDVKEKVITLPAGKEATPEQSSSLSHCLETTGELMDKAQSFGEKVAELSIKAAPVLVMLKSLFGV
jgi:hypothetical protein